MTRIGTPFCKVLKMLNISDSESSIIGLHFLENEKRIETNATAESLVLFYDIREIPYFSLFPETSYSVIFCFPVSRNTSRNITLTKLCITFLVTLHCLTYYSINVNLG